jgi:hypothetical protein
MHEGPTDGPLLARSICREIVRADLNNCDQPPGEKASIPRIIKRGVKYALSGREADKPEIGDQDALMVWPSAQGREQFRTRSLRGKANAYDRRFNGRTSSLGRCVVRKRFKPLGLGVPAFKKAWRHLDSN